MKINPQTFFWHKSAVCLFIRLAFVFKCMEDFTSYFRKKFLDLNFGGRQVGSDSGEQVLDYTTRAFYSRRIVGVVGESPYVVESDRLPLTLADFPERSWNEYVSVVLSEEDSWAWQMTIFTTDSIERLSTKGFQSERLQSFNQAFVLNYRHFYPSLLTFFFECLAFDAFWRKEIFFSFQPRTAKENRMKKNGNNSVVIINIKSFS